MIHDSPIEKSVRITLIIAALIMVVSWYFKDNMPEPSFYQMDKLVAPIQQPSDKPPFKLSVNNQNYIVTPQFSYQLNGVVVSSNNAAQFGNIWHHKRWKDFLNLRDLCVIWGNNVSSGIYHRLDFNNDSWTCWVSWQDRETGKIFKMNQLSNNHILTDDDWIKRNLMQAEVGDQIQFSGYLASYENPGNQFKRGTSITRDDTGNGACETIYLNDFIIIKKANKWWRMLYSISFYTMIISALVYLCLILFKPRIKKDNLFKTKHF